MFADPDIQIPKDKYGVVNRYEWAITDQSDIGRLHTRWHELRNFYVIPHKYKVNLHKYCIHCSPLLKPLIEF
jgi:hypothetical protein